MLHNLHYAATEMEKILNYTGLAMYIYDLLERNGTAKKENKRKKTKDPKKEKMKIKKQ